MGNKLPIDVFIEILQTNLLKTASLQLDHQAVLALAQPIDHLRYERDQEDQHAKNDKAQSDKAG